MRAEDALKYVAQLLWERTEWTTDGIAGSECGGCHDIELDALSDIASEVFDIAAMFGSLRTYSDGRVVKTRKEIAEGLVTEHVWHPDPSVEKPRTWRSSLPSGDPDLPSPGLYEVTTDPSGQQIHVRVVRLA
ncbi:hypothetical protein JABBAWOKKIE_62 [Mycobacterium phage Jabbawokkie]|uniref:Uncharacterized protein n=1 Tax=Mycobacterium phage Zapner TaxID=1486474 RepID=A0A059VKT0_9CAUD|nr:hypothetical protein N850_gp060 [Mycobacterium phage Jabbawokkie]YP_009963977.1 hypothetical protein I5I04_gp060 [Mycobacterium phage Zapner]AGT12161.1 hypothetical protein JABBAWOKKIE_62 [Mycobacterium phage Jabbawokkie]AHZ95514.1 hypothetical protein PBI_ZAPNER_60 [Mycobacterium phage Zapner]